MVVVLQILIAALAGVGLVNYGFGVYRCRQTRWRVELRHEHSELTAHQLPWLTFASRVEAQLWVDRQVDRDQFPPRSGTVWAVVDNGPSWRRAWRSAFSSRA